MSAQAPLPPKGPDGLRHWMVAGGVIADDRGVLMVKNRRKNGDTDWTTPGGVVDPGESPLDGLTREVNEETGLIVAQWSEVLYRVEVTAPDMGFYLRVQAHRARRFSGQISLNDPDEIVVEAEFLALDAALERMSTAQPWVVEPMSAHLRHGVDDGRLFSYRVDGARGSERKVTRLHDHSD